MSDHSESFRSELTARLLSSMPDAQVKNVLIALDSTIQSYDISRKPLEIIPAGGIPEEVKYFLASKMIENVSPRTIYIYKLRLIDFFDTLKKSPQDIRAGDIRIYLGYYKTIHKASDSYLDNIRRVLHSFFAWLVNNEYLIRNPCSTVERIKYQEHQREPLSPYNLEVLRWYCKSLREKAIVDIFYSTGVRLSELRNLNKNDINWEKRSVSILHGKGNKRRIVFFNAEAELSLQKYLESRSDEDEALFVKMRKPHTRLSPRGIENIVKNIAQRAGLHVYPHLLRHTFGTAGLHGGMPIEELQVLMGHAEPRTTMIYAKIDTQNLQRDHDRIFS